jgi:toxin ParE1/3/4
MNYRFHRAAVGEHLDNVNFYEDRLPGLGADYLAEFDAVMSRICNRPDLYPIVDVLGIHKAGLKRFPFSIIYRIMPTHIDVLAVAHQRRRPAYWLGRSVK